MSIGWCGGTHRATGEEVRARFAHVWILADGKITRFEQSSTDSVTGQRRDELTTRSRLAGVDRDEVMRWVVKYEQAWRDGDLGGVERLFTEDARYRPSPYDDSAVGHDAIKAFWLDDEGETFTVSATPVAVDGRDAVVRVLVRYGDPIRQEYTDLWVLRFAEDGRVEDYEEWAYWPGKAHSAADE